MKILGIIPARYASSRFPGKPLAMIDGKSMIQRVYEQTLKCNKLSSVIIATDSEIIEKHIKQYTDKGYDISHIHRTNRSGYKAGALKEGLKLMSLSHRKR